MSRQFVDLPSEIFDVIFRIIRDESNFRCLLQCELVCKSWKTSAQKCLYTNIEFRNEKEVKTLIHSLTCQPNSDPGKFTRSVVYNGCIEDVKKETWSLFKIFEYLFGKRDETPWINSFIEVFPYVRNISLAKEDSSYFWVLVNAFGSGKWKEMEYIGKCPEEFIDSHNACALWNKNTLKTLHVCDSKENGFCSLYNQIHIFPKLKELYMETNQYSFFEYAEYVTEAKPGLETLSYANLKGTNFHSLTSYKPVDLLLIKPQPNIKKLLIQITSYENDNFLQYLITKFPNLQSIRINQKSNALIHGPMLDEIKLTRNNFSAPVLSKFMAFVSKCDDHLIDLLYTTQYPGKILSSYWKLCDPKKPKVVAITYFEGYGYRELYGLTGEMVRLRMNIPSSLGSSVILFNYSWLTFTLPHIPVLEECGNEIDHLILSINRSWRPLHYYEDMNGTLHLDSTDLMKGFCFGHAIKNCTKLKVLHFQQSTLVLLDYDRHVFYNTSITDLILEDVFLATDTLTQLSKQLPSLKRLRMTRVGFSSDCNPQPLVTFHNTIDMPETSFRYLEAKNYVVQNFTTAHFLLPKSIQIRLTTKDGEKFYKFKVSSLIIPPEDDNFCMDKDNIDYFPEVTRFSPAAEIDEKEYQFKINNNLCSGSLHIICESLNYLILSFGTTSSSFGCSVLMPDKNTDSNVASMNEEEICAYYLNRDH